MRLESSDHGPHADDAREHFTAPWHRSKADNYFDLIAHRITQKAYAIGLKINNGDVKLDKTH